MQQCEIDPLNEPNNPKRSSRIHQSTSLNTISHQPAIIRKRPMQCATTRRHFFHHDRLETNYGTNVFSDAFSDALLGDVSRRRQTQLTARNNSLLALDEREWVGSNRPLRSVRRGIVCPMEFYHDRALLSLRTSSVHAFYGPASASRVPPFNLSFAHKYEDRDLLAVSDECGYISILNTRPQQQKGDEHEFFVNGSQPAAIARWDGHSNAIFDIQWSFDDERILTAAGDQMACIWDVETRSVLYCMQGHEMSVKCIRQSPHMRTVFATGSRDGNVRLWDTRMVNRRLAMSSIQTTLRIPRFEGFNEQQQQQQQQQQEQEQQQQHGSEQPVDLDEPEREDAHRILSKGSCHVLDPDGVGTLRDIHGIPEYEEDSQDESDGMQASISSGSLLTTPPPKRRRKRRRVSSALRRSRVRSGIGSRPQQSVTCLEFTANANELVTAGAVDGRVKFWDMRAIRNTKGKSPSVIPQPIKVLTHQSRGIPRRHYGISSLALDCTRTKLLVNTTNHQVMLYDLCHIEKAVCGTSNKEEQIPHSVYSGHINSSFYVKSAFSPDGQYIVSGSCDQNIYIWKTSPYPTTTTPFHEDDNSTASVYKSDRTSPYWHIHTPSFVLRGHTGEVSGTTWSPHGDHQIASCSDDATVRIWTCFRDELCLPDQGRAFRYEEPHTSTSRVLLDEDDEEEDDDQRDVQRGVFSIPRTLSTRSSSATRRNDTIASQAPPPVQIRRCTSPPPSSTSTGFSIETPSPISQQHTPRDIISSMVQSPARPFRSSSSSRITRTNNVVGSTRTRTTSTGSSSSSSTRTGRNARTLHDFWASSTSSYNAQRDENSS